MRTLGDNSIVEEGCHTGDGKNGEKETPTGNHGDKKFIIRHQKLPAAFYALDV